MRTFSCLGLYLYVTMFSLALFKLDGTVNSYLSLDFIVLT